MNPIFTVFWIYLLFIHHPKRLSLSQINFIPATQTEIAETLGKTLKGGVFVLGQSRTGLSRNCNLVALFLSILVFLSGDARSLFCTKNIRICFSFYLFTTLKFEACDSLIYCSCEADRQKLHLFQQISRVDVFYVMYIAHTFSPLFTWIPFTRVKGIFQYLCCGVI